MAIPPIPSRDGIPAAFFDRLLVTSSVFWLFSTVQKLQSMRKPRLDRDAPIAVTLFSGGGGIETGLVAAGIRPVVSVDCDPTDKGFSRQIQFCRDRNFEQYGTQSYLATVQEVAEKDFVGIPRQPFILHASPVCSSFSKLSLLNGKRESEEDINAAIATAKAIEVLRPQWFTLENAVGYRQSESYEIIVTALNRCSYYFDCQEIDMVNFGVPQNRSRLILVAGLGKLSSIISSTTSIKGWGNCLDGLILTQPELLLQQQEKAILLANLAGHFNTAIVQRVGVCKRGKDKASLRRESEPCWAITKAMFRDSKGSSRGGITYWDNFSKKAYKLPMRAVARIGGFPDWYDLPDREAIAGSIIGLSVPPLFAGQLFSHLQTYEYISN